MDGSTDTLILSKVFTGGDPFATPVITSKMMDDSRPARLKEVRELSLTKAAWEMAVRCWHQDSPQRPTMTEVVRLAREWSVFSLTP